MPHSPETAPAILKFDGPHRFLSNFYATEVVYNGVSYPTSEHAYQAAKATDPRNAEWVREAHTGAAAKSRGRLLNLPPDWGERRNSIMLDILRAKHANPAMAHMLLSTEDAYLEEGNTWHDQYWGSCKCSMHYGVTGQNWLGKLLMQVREELRDGQR